MEEGHLHDGINTRCKPALTRNFCRVDHKEAGFFLIKNRLHFLRQARPDFICAVRRIEQENTARFEAFGHLVFIDKLQLMAADKICLATPGTPNESGVR